VDDPTTSTRDAFCADLRLAAEVARASVVASRSAAAATTWSHAWVPYCRAEHCDFYLRNCNGDPISYFLVFALRYRSGALSKSGKPVRSNTVSDAIFHVAQAFTSVGSLDPRLDRFGNLDPRLARMYTTWRNEDPPPKRVKPVPIQIRFVPSMSD
jgi:hypothetical protein